MLTGDPINTILNVTVFLFLAALVWIYSKS
jgi:hypothetical protein